MYPFSNAVTPAIRSHLDAQVAFFNDLSKSFTRSVQDLVDANIRLNQTLIEESSIAGQKLLTTEGPTDAIAIAAARAQPAADKLRAYQQHISRVAADAQVELARVTEQHVQETARTARALADEVARVASDETRDHLRKQQESLNSFRDPFQHDGAQRSGGVNAAGGGVQFEADGAGVSVQGNVQAGQQAGAKGAAKAH